MDNVPILDKVTGLFNSFSDLVPISVVSIDGSDDDEEPDPLIKIVPNVETEVLERTLEQGIGFNAAVRVGSKEGTFNFNMNPFSDNPSLDGSLKIPEIDILDLGVVKISGVPNGTDTDLNLDLMVSPSETYFKGDGIIELFGIEAAKADFNFSSRGIEVSELSFGPLKLLDAYIKESDGGIALGGQINIFGLSMEASLTGNANKFELEAGTRFDLPGWLNNLGIPDGYIDFIIGTEEISVKTPIFDFTLDIEDIVKGVEYLHQEIENAFLAVFGEIAQFFEDGWNFISDSAVGILNEFSGFIEDVEKFLNDIARSGHDRELLGRDNDIFNGRGGNDSIYGSYGDDTLVGREGNDRIHGEYDNDRLGGGSGNDTLYGGTGHDTLLGGSGNDTLDGESGNDILGGDSGDDRLYGKSGDDKLVGGSGNDLIHGHDGNDILGGGSGNDTLDGGSGSDELDGDSGNDRIWRLRTKMTIVNTLSLE